MGCFHIHCKIIIIKQINIHHLTVALFVGGKHYLRFKKYVFFPVSFITLSRFLCLSALMRSKKYCAKH